ncbi:MAG TPA: hypothetical protein PKE55_08400 [Kiritimatiellia bacterium]|nr:hypothetical protein [Kiritimatiellia bacterium]
MKRLVLFVLALGLGPTAALAQSIGLYGSFWKPKDDLSAYGYGTRILWPVAEPLAIELRASSFLFEQRIASVKRETEIIPLEAGLLLTRLVDDLTTWYAGGGAGYYLIDRTFREDRQTISASVDDEFGGYLVTGLKLALSPSLSFVLEAKYTWVKAESIRFRFDQGGSETRSLSDSYDGLSVQLGFAYAW